jgi:hypothetical protein
VRGIGPWTIATIAAIVLTVNCKGSSEDDSAPAVLPKSYSFSGKIEPKYVGNWTSIDGNSKMDILKDGGLKIETTSRSVVGKSVVEVSGQWLAGGGSLMFQYLDKSSKPVVLKYSTTLSGKTLILVQAGGHLKTAYKRS